MLTSTNRFGAGTGTVCDELGTIISAIKPAKRRTFSAAFFSCRRVICRIVATSLLTCASSNGNVASVQILVKMKGLEL